MSTTRACASRAEPGFARPGTMRRAARPGRRDDRQDARRQLGHGPAVPAVLAATIWVGGQMALAALVPVLRRSGAGVPRAAARRFNQVA